MFEELDYQPTSIGPISLRRWRELRLDVFVLEIVLGDEHLMSYLFNAFEIGLAKIGLDAIPGDTSLSVVVGGLGMGLTADTSLSNLRIDNPLVVEKLTPMINWHKSGLIPFGKSLINNPKCRLIDGDFFEMANRQDEFDPAHLGRKFDEVLIVIDHAPDFHLALHTLNFISQLAQKNWLSN